MACVYFSSSVSLGLLEIMVHLTDYRVLRSYEIFSIQVPASEIQSLSINDLPDNWRSNPSPQSTADIGDDWIRQGQSLALQVPSVIIPTEANYVLNLKAAAYRQVIEQAEKVDFELDVRLARGG